MFRASCGVQREGTRHDQRTGGAIGDRKCGALRIPREDWGTLGKIGGITIPTLRILLLCSRNEGMMWHDVAVLHCFGLLW